MYRELQLNDICSEWVCKGYEVTVITGIPNYPQGEFYPSFGFRKKRKEIWNGVTIYRIPIFPRGNSSGMLVLNYLSFVVSGFFWSFTTKLQADAVFVFEVSPMTQALPGIWFAGKRNIPCYLYVMDLWPENVKAAAGINNKAVLGFIGRIVDYIYSHSTKIFTS